MSWKMYTQYETVDVQGLHCPLVTSLKMSANTSLDPTDKALHHKNQSLVFCLPGMSALNQERRHYLSSLLMLKCVQTLLSHKSKRIYQKSNTAAQILFQSVELVLLTLVNMFILMESAQRKYTGWRLCRSYFLGILDFLISRK